MYPNSDTAWHFDDKLVQKYLLEAIDAPLVPTYVFFDRKTATDWIDTADFPIVFKLRRGAGSENVRLVRTYAEAKALATRAFKKGFSSYNGLQNFHDRIYRYRNGQSSVMDILKGVIRLIIKPDFAKIVGRERGYLYFQKYLANNDFDTRVIVIGDKAFAIRRYVRKGDFRASGSGLISHRREDIDERCIQLAFQYTHTLSAQSMAFDFLMNDAGKPMIVEISYAFTPAGYDECPGYWDRSLQWHSGSFIEQHWILEEILQTGDNDLKNS